MLNLAKKNDVSALKEFARAMIWAFPLIFMGLLPWLFNANIPWWPLVISASLVLLYVAYPPGLYYPYRLWMAIATVLGWVNTRLILGLAFYLLIMPIGLVMRGLGKLQYQGHKPKGSYWITRQDKLTKDKLENPF